MRESIEFNYTNDEGDEVTVDLPARFELCPTCEGRGAHSRDLGAITEEDRERDWSHDEWESYMHGGYDRECETCKGQRVVAVLDRRACDREMLRRYDEREEREADYRALCAFEQRWGC